MRELFLVHEGVKRKSGRYPWGSGENPYQHEPWFDWANKERGLRAKGLSDTEIAQGMGISTTTLRKMRSLVKERTMAIDSAEAYRLRQKGMSKSEIGRRMGINESQVRALLKRHEKPREDTIQNIAEELKKNVSARKYLDVGKGTELYMGVAETKKNAALYLLEQQGYKVHTIYVEQQNNPKQKTTMIVLTPPGVDIKEVNKHRDRIHILEERSFDNGKTFLNIEPPQNIDSSRVYIRYAEDGGKNKDGVIELRRGVEDLTMGNSKYAQVRIGVDGTHYLKGMALYSDDIPKGYDIVYNTNKSNKVDKYDVFKKQELDKDNPFGAVLKEATGQRHYIGKDGKDHLSAINIVNEEGDWNEWKKSIASQMLSKQELQVARQQLSIAYNSKREELNDILALENPVVKRRLLNSFADDCDSAAVQLKGAAFPGQASKVIIPLTSIKDNEVYAPHLTTGTRVALIRFPHGGRFEIPELIVNNKNKEGSKTITNTAMDAIGINASVAEKLSGADFDGDTVLVIPNNDGRIKSRPSLQGLKNYDPKESYPAYPGMPKVTDKNFNTQIEMGNISNLITDMTLKGASDGELARAVRHSMTVIDAKKHNLDHNTSYTDNGIAELKKTYQGSAKAGASTLISKAKSPVYINERKLRTSIDPETGEKIFYETGRSYIKKATGEKVYYKTEVPKMAMTNDANTLSSGLPMERAYADHANKLKAMANEARKEVLASKNYPRSSSAAKTYAAEVTSLEAKLATALRNAPISRKAQLVASMVVNAKLKDNPSLRDKANRKELNKVRSQALAAATARYGASRREKLIDITPKEWEAIQARAISSSRLNEMLRFTDLDIVKKYATPRTLPAMTPSKIAAAKAMLDLGYSQAEVAQRFDVSVTTLMNAI